MLTGLPGNEATAHARNTSPDVVRWVRPGAGPGWAGAGYGTVPVRVVGHTPLDQRMRKLKLQKPLFIYGLFHQLQ